MKTTGRRAAVGLSLPCAFVLCALCAQSAVAAEAKNTTPFTCVFVGKKAGDFADAHCDKGVPQGQGDFGHVVLKVNEKTNVSISNEKTKNETKESTSTVLKGTIAGVKSEIICKTVAGSGSLTSEEPEAKKHRFKFFLTIKHSSCSMPKPALGCKVKEPVEASFNGEGVEELGAGKNEMGLEFKPAGEHFGSFTVEGCIIAGTYNVDGTAIATGTPSPTEKHSGATVDFTLGMSEETLKLAGNPAGIEGAATLTMAGGNPISFTTVT